MAVINAYEAGEELVPERVQRFSLIHPRCGTAFLLWVMVIAIFVFAFLGRPPLPWLIASRILLLPLIAGLAYELIRFAGKHTGNRVLMTLLAPGLWLQRLTNYGSYAESDFEEADVTSPRHPDHEALLAILRPYIDNPLVDMEMLLPLFPEVVNAGESNPNLLSRLDPEAAVLALRKPGPVA